MTKERMVIDNKNTPPMGRRIEVVRWVHLILRDNEIKHVVTLKRREEHFYSMPVDPPHVRKPMSYSHPREAFSG